MDKANVRAVCDLRVWQIGMDISISCHKLTKMLPKHEL
jgi:hypothetical protein